MKMRFILHRKRAPCRPTLRAVTCAVLLAAGILPTAAVAAPPAGLPAGKPVVVQGLAEASGVAWDAKRSRFYVVGDRGALVELDANGRNLRRWSVRGNLEDVTAHGPSGLLVLLAETAGELVVFDVEKGVETARIALDSEAILGKEAKESNQGFEGLAFQPASGRPGGGVFHLVHQSKPARMVALQFDPARPPKTLDAGAVIGRQSPGSRDDLTAVSWAEPLRALLVIAEKADRLLVLSAAGELQSELALPGTQQEGLSLAPDGSLWIADDKAGLYRIEGAQAALVEASRSSKRP